MPPSSETDSQGVAISALAWQNDFVEQLPGDPEARNYTRAVTGAAWSPVAPTPVAAPRLLALVPEVASLLGLSTEETPELVEVLAGNRVLPGMAPYAACYGGHQFGHWAGELGDGRALTLGEVVNPRGERWEVQLKGAGPTPYSRRADGRAVLRSSLRELVCSEAMHHLGVPTTRALSLVLTGDPVMRDLLYDGHPALEPGAITTRVAPSFLRFGNFELPSSRKDYDLLRRLLRFTLERHFPQHLRGDTMNVPAFVEEVSRRTARMIVHWMRVGFVHGVMNTDNMSILGLTIDYGPYGWLEVFDPGWTPNTTDASGRRYRYGHQPAVAHWNLLQLAQALVPVTDELDALQRALDAYGDELSRLQREMLLDKLGLTAAAGSEADDDLLIGAMFAVLQAVETDMTLFFRHLADLPAESSTEARVVALREAFYAPEVLTAADVARIGAWLDQYSTRLRSEKVGAAERRARMNRVNPLYVPRNYLVQTVIERSEGGDRAPLAELLEVLRRPYDEQPGRGEYALKRPEWARNRPGCSMLSCSS